MGVTRAIGSGGSRSSLARLAIRAIVAAVASLSLVSASLARVPGPVPLVPPAFAPDGDGLGIGDASARIGSEVESGGGSRRVAGSASGSRIAGEAAPTRLGGSTMGTSWSALVPDTLDDAGRRALRARRAAALALIDIARDIARATDGAYDVTLGPLIERWGFGGGGSRTEDIAPDDAVIAAALRTVGDDALVRGPGTLAKAHRDVAVDLSSLAKGFAVDRLGEILAASGHAAYLVEIGGEVRTRGSITRAPSSTGTAWS